MTDPFFITGPASIAFSGGRTSAYMLWRILQAHGGTLPDDVLVHFANTGREHEKTLRFVHECGVRWNVSIAWLEYVPAGMKFETVGYNSAARNGEPFRALVESRKFLPNGVMRFCTAELKVKASERWLKSLGWPRWTAIVGIRYDEQPRVIKILERNLTSKDCWKTALPLHNAKITKRDVLAFWREQPFDLGLEGWEGNCDGCFLKGRKTLRAMEALKPGTLQWWADMEALAGSLTSGTAAQFDQDWSYAQLMAEAHAQPDLFIDDPDEFDAECGTWCGAPRDE